MRPYRKVLISALRLNTPASSRYERHAVRFGPCFPSPKEQEVYGTASTDQGNVSHELPAIHAIYRIETPQGADNHTVEFAEAAKSSQAHEETIKSSKALACVAVDFLSMPEFRDEVRDAFCERSR